MAPQSVQADGRRFTEALKAWRSAKAGGDISRITSFNTADFSSNGKALADWTPVLRAELGHAHGRDIHVKDLSYLR